jgi:hypothetical protein
MEFKQVKACLVQAIKSGNWEAEGRAEGSKNLLKDIGAELACSIVNATRGTQAESSSHHFLAVTVWIFKPIYKGEKWYVKFYFAKGTFVVSFHPSA